MEKFVRILHETKERPQESCDVIVRFEYEYDSNLDFTALVPYSKVHDQFNNKDKWEIDSTYDFEKNMAWWAYADQEQEDKYSIDK